MSPKCQGSLICIESRVAPENGWLWHQPPSLTDKYWRGEGYFNLLMPPHLHSVIFFFLCMKSLHVNRWMHFIIRFANFIYVFLGSLHVILVPRTVHNSYLIFNVSNINILPSKHIYIFLWENIYGRASMLMSYEWRVWGISLTGKMCCFPWMPIFSCSSTSCSLSFDITWSLWYTNKYVTRHSLAI